MCQVVVLQHASLQAVVFIMPTLSDSMLWTLVEPGGDTTSEPEFWNVASGVSRFPLFAIFEDSHENDGVVFHLG